MPDPSPSPIPSTFDEFEEQQRSFDKMEGFGKALAEQAACSAKARPGERMVGLIVESDVPDVAAIRSVLGIAGANPEGDVVGVVSRHFALRIAGVLGDEDDAMKDGTDGPMRHLPILFVAKTGCRWGRAVYTVDEPSA
jgi:hypothetical protein